MNVTIKPLVWAEVDESRSAEVVFEATGLGLKFVVGRRRFFSGPWIVCVTNSHVVVDGPAGDNDTADEAKLAAERWYTAKVLDCLEPADKATCAEFVTTYAQCNGEYD